MDLKTFLSKNAESWLIILGKKNIFKNGNFDTKKFKICILRCNSWIIVEVLRLRNKLIQDSERKRDIGREGKRKRDIGRERKRKRVT